MNKQPTDDARFLELLERWLNGAFDRADERELHALSESDAFRREVWEGFSALPETAHETHLAEIRRRLKAKTPARRVPIGAWMAAAAALALVVAAVWFWPGTPPVADSAPTAQVVEKTATPVPDGAGTTNDLAAAEPPPETTASAPSPTPTTPSAQPLAKQTPQPDAGIFAATSEEAVGLDDVPAKTEQAAGRARPDIQPVQQNAGVAAPPPAAVPAFDRAAAPAREMAKPVMDDLEPLARKKADRARTAEPTRTTGAMTTAGPAGGWENFRDYLRRNARLPEAARNNNISGSVLLQFAIGPDGKPVQVQFLRKLGHGCEEEAERLVRLFDWAPPGAAPVVVDVPFRQ